MVTRFARMARVWDVLSARPAGAVVSPRRPRRLALEPLEDRVVPARPLSDPVIAVGAGAGAVGVVNLYDTDTGNILQSWTPYPGFTGGVRVGVGDLTGDGYPDVVTTPGPGGGPHVRVFDGKTGQQVPGPLGNFVAFSPAFTGGVNEAVLADFTGDGRVDLAVAADAGGGPHVRVFDGQTGTELASFYAFEPQFAGGVRLAAGRFTMDVAAQLVVAAGVGGGTRIKVLAIPSVTPIPGPLGDFFAADPADRGGVYVAGGDVTANVRSDLVVGVAGTVRVWDGISVKVIRTLPVAGPATGGVRVATLFADDDAATDIVIASGPGAGRVRTYAGATGVQLSGPAGDFDPGIGVGGSGVSIAAGNDPGPNSIVKGGTSIAPYTFFTPGQAFTITQKVEAVDIQLPWTNPYTGQTIPGTPSPT